MPHRLSRRSLMAGLPAAGLATCLSAAEPAHDISFAEDFEELWTTLGARYCFFGEKCTDWTRVRALYRPQAIAAPDLDRFTDVVRRVLAELYDAHTHLSDPPDGTPRWPLYDILPRDEGQKVRVAAVQPGSAAAGAGVRIGDRVLAVDGVPIRALQTSLGPRCLRGRDPKAEQYALEAAVAGRRGAPRQMRLERDGRVLDLVLPLSTRPDEPDVSSRLLPGGFGLIRIASFASTDAVGAFDRALDPLRATRGLMIDVRGNGGGDTAVARPIMGRFITERRAYARMRRRSGPGLGPFWTEQVEPRGAAYLAPVVVLCDHWSGSMAEGFPMGMRDIGRARIVGTRMMGLGAAVFPIRLDRTGIAAQYSAEPVYDTAGAPRWTLRPDVLVADGEDILAAGMKTLEALVQRA